jgi:hypothetical protein
MGGKLDICRLLYCRSMHTVLVRVLPTTTEFTDRLAPFLLSLVLSTTTCFFAFTICLGFEAEVGISFAAFLALDVAFLTAFSACFTACL